MWRALLWLNLYGREAVRHKLKNRQKVLFCIFRPFLSLCWIVSQPYRLSHNNALHINQFYSPKDQSMKFSLKNIENWRSWKMRFLPFFWVGHYEFFFWDFFFSSQWKDQRLSYEVSFISELWMVSSESWKRLHPN